MEAIFVDQNINKTIEHKSPSGKYKLVINYYTTWTDPARKTWDYTKGTIYDMDDKEIGCIKRNYSSFPFLFFNKGNVEYLVSGRSYMSQTILNCETGKIYDNTDDVERDDFCWASVEQVDENTVLVNGCYWGANYEYRFYDFSDFESGWKLLEMDERINRRYYLDDVYGNISCKINNGIVRIKQKEEWIKVDELGINMLHDDYVDEYGYGTIFDDDNYYYKTNILLEVKRIDDKIEIVNLELSEKQKQKEAEDDEEKRRVDERNDVLKAQSELYQCLIPEIKKLKLNMWERINVRHDNTVLFCITIKFNKRSSCVIEFEDGKDISFKFYDWKVKDNCLNLTFDNNINSVSLIIDKINESQLSVQAK